jgi:hypothetical protein
MDSHLLEDSPLVADSHQEVGSRQVEDNHLAEQVDNLELESLLWVVGKDLMVDNLDSEINNIGRNTDNSQI